MDWISRFRAAGKPEMAAPWNATVVSGAYDTQKAIRSSPENTASPGGRPDTLTEEIKRRQISLAVRYVTIVRAL